MAEGDQIEDTGGTAALSVASSHLSTLISGADAMDAKATFIVAVNIALFGVFFGSVLSISDSMTKPDWMALVAPASVSFIVLLIGAWTVRPRDLEQFSRPGDMLEAHMTGGFSSDQLAWSYVDSIADATEKVSAVLDKKASGVGWLALLTVANVAAMAASTAAWLA